MASQVQMVNLALLKFGNVSIQAISDSTPQARFASVLWDIVRDELLSSYGWNFAMKQVILDTPSATTPDFKYDYKFTLPADYLRVWDLYDCDLEYEVMGGELYISTDEVNLEYIAKITDVSLWPSAFVRCMATSLASELCLKMTGDDKRASALKMKLENIDIPQAYKLNAIEGNKALHKNEQNLTKGNLEWQKEGR